MDRQVVDGLPGELHRRVRRPVDADLADDVEDEVLGGQVRRERAVEDEAQRRRHAHPQFAGAEHEGGVGVADAGGEQAEGAARAGVAVGAEEHVAGAVEAFLGERHVADALVARRPDVVEVPQLLLLGHLPEEAHVAVGVRVGGEDVVVGDDDDAVGVPELRVAPEFAQEDLVGGRPADVVRHERVGRHPDGLARRDAVASGSAGEDGFGDGHGGVGGVVGLWGVSGWLWSGCRSRAEPNRRPRTLLTNSPLTIAPPSPRAEGRHDALAREAHAVAVVAVGFELVQSLDVGLGARLQHVGVAGDAAEERAAVVDEHRHFADRIGALGDRAEVVGDELVRLVGGGVDGGVEGRDGAVAGAALGACRVGVVLVER